MTSSEISIAPGRRAAPRKSRCVSSVRRQLMLQASYARGTKDSDVLETVDLDARIRAQVLSVVDVVVSKLKRLHAYDLQDIEAIHRVERNLLGVPETAIELPSWLDQ